MEVLFLGGCLHGKTLNLYPDWAIYQVPIPRSDPVVEMRETPVIPPPMEIQTYHIHRAHQDRKEWRFAILTGKDPMDVLAEVAGVHLKLITPTKEPN